MGARASQYVPRRCLASSICNLLLVACSSSVPAGDGGGGAAADSSSGNGSAGTTSALAGSSAAGNRAIGTGKADGAVPVAGDGALDAGTSSSGGSGSPPDAGTIRVPGALIDCRKEPTFSDDPELPQRFEGDNGTFTDACTADGNLTKHACELVPDPACMPVPPNPPPCPSVATGQVLEQEIDCRGTCQAGACEGSCPQFDDALEVLALEGDSVVFSTPDPARRLHCALFFEQPDDGFDCATVRVGQRGFISSLGLQQSYCTGGAFGNIGACFQADCTQQVQNCSYACSIEPS
jgi:hypothetical protein